MRHPVFVLLAGASLAIAAPDDAPAIVTTSCSAFSQYDPNGPTGPVTDDESTAGSCSSSIAESLAALGSDGEADVGSFLSRAEATTLEGPRPDEATTFNQVQFRDTITVSSEGRSGTATVRGEAFLSGVIDVTGTGRAGVQLNVITNPGSISEVEREDCFLSTICFGSFDPYPRIVSGYYEVAFNVTLGQSLLFGLSLSTSAAHGGSLTTEAGSALSDFSAGGSVSWSGITEVEQNGSPIPYTIQSESGTDWTQPVPEPADWLAGLIALLVMRARRR